MNNLEIKRPSGIYKVVSTKKEMDVLVEEGIPATRVTHELTMMELIGSNKGELGFSVNGTFVYSTQDVYEFLREIKELPQTKNWFRALSTPMPKLAYFEGEETKEVSFNDKIQSRGREKICILQTKNFATLFTGSSISGLCVVTSSEYEKNGKWSNTTYKLTLAAGVKMSVVAEGFESGMYCSDLSDFQKIVKSFGLECNLSASRLFIQGFFPKYWEKHRSIASKIEELENSIEVDTIEYHFESYRVSKKNGYNRLIVDGEVFDSIKNPISSKVIVLSNHNESYKLLLPANAVIDEECEGDLYFNQKTMCYQVDAPNEDSLPSEDSPFFGMFDALK